MVLAAGLGTRLGKLTAFKPKALVEINGDPLLKITLLRLKKAGIKKVVINVHHFSNQIISFLKQNNYFDLEIIISDETSLLLDTGGGLLKALPHFSDDESVLIHNVDVISNLDLNLFFGQFLKSKADAFLAVRQRESSRKLLFDQNMSLCGWNNQKNGEFKWVETMQTDYLAFAFSGIHIIKPPIFDTFPIQKCSIIDLYLELAKNNMVKAYKDENNYWYDLGKAEDLIICEKEIKSYGNNF